MVCFLYYEQSDKLNKLTINGNSIGLAVSDMCLSTHIVVEQHINDKIIRRNRNIIWFISCDQYDSSADSFVCS